MRVSLDPAPRLCIRREASAAFYELRPKVTEHYWGYETRLNEQVLSLAVCLRAASGLVTIASFIAAIGIWLLPAAAFSGAAVATKVAVSASLICLAFMAARLASRGTQVRVQLDTAKGEPVSYTHLTLPTKA